MSQGAILIKADATTAGIFPANGSDFQLEELQGFVDGLIEIVTISENVIMVVNEDGKGCLPKNVMATVLAKAHGAIFPEDHIAGNVLLCPSDMVK